MNLLKMSARWMIVIELIGFVALLLLSKRVAAPYFWRYAGPVTLIGTLFILTVYLRQKNINWSQMGLSKLKTKKAYFLLIPQALLTIVVILGIGVGSHLLGSAMGFEFMKETPQGVEDRWGDVVGNLGPYLLWVSIAWISGGFAEEMFFRGYLITRIGNVFANAKYANTLAVILPALLFGYGHYYYQGLRGLITTGLIGLGLGILFVAYKRNLWPLIIGHACVDTLVFTAMYLNLDA